MDLGERDDTETGRRIFPRACACCTVLTVYTQLIDHVGPASSEGGRFCAYCDEPILPTGKCTTFVKLSNSAGGWTLEPDSVAYGREGFLSDGSG